MGSFRGFALVNGRAAGVWAIRNRRIVIEPYLRVSDEITTALERDAGAVLKFLGL